MVKIIFQSAMMGVAASGAYFTFETYGPAQAPVRAYEEFARARRMNHYDIARPLTAGPALATIMKHEADFDKFLASLESGDRTQQKEMYGEVHNIEIEIKSREPAGKDGVRLVAVETVRRLKGGRPMVGVAPDTEYEHKVEVRNYSSGWKIFSFDETIIVDPNETRQSSHAPWGRMAK